MAISPSIRAILLMILPCIGIAARVQRKGPGQDSGAFQCPSECWQCCAARVERFWGRGWRSSGEQFKCILRNVSTLPRHRACEEPVGRRFEPDSIKTYCAFNSGESTGRPGEHCETQSKASKLLDWLWQKKGEVFGLANANMAELASIVGAVRLQGRQQNMVLPLSQLSSIHPIDEPGAIEKTAGRARAAQAARAVLDQAPYTMSKAIIASYPGLQEFQSITGFYVVKLGEDEYVTFEGNGRCVALLWAFPEGDELRDRLKIEVTEFVIDDETEREKIVQRILALQKNMGSREFQAIRPPSLDEEEVAEWAKGVKDDLERLKANATGSVS